MEYVLDENGNIKIKDGKPVVKGADGKEFTIDAIGAQEKITALNTESKDHRLKAKQYKDELVKFEGIKDPAAAIEALSTVASMSDDHKLEIGTLKTEMEKAYGLKLEEKDTSIADLTGKLYNLNVTKNFAISEVVKKTILTPDIAASFFGKNFKEDGTATDSTGNVIYSKERPGEPANFEEAMTVLIDAYPGKEAILKAPSHSGSETGKTGDAGGNDQQMSSVGKIKEGLKNLRA